VPSVSVLPIRDDIVAPHLELLRRVCDPTSNSLPHITVRYFKRLAVPASYSTVKVRYVDLLEPGSFISSAGQGTVFIRCTSDDLNPLEHKPDFPTSEFHITVCDEANLNFAEELLSVLRQFHWCIRLALPKRTRLETTDVRPRNPRGAARRIVLGARARRLFKEISGEILTWRGLDNLTEGRRLKLARSICRHLESATRSHPRIPDCGSDADRSSETASSHSEAAIHLTPPELAREIARYTVKFIDPSVRIQFGDPAIGTGAFYSALLQVINPDRIESAIGVDVNLAQVAAARARWGHRGMETRAGDYLHMERLPGRNLILANPPYLRHQAIEPEYKLKLRQRASIVHRDPVDARAGLYVYFMLLTHAWMTQGAVAAWLIPSAFMDADYGRVLRRYLTREVQLIRIHRFRADDPQFENAKVLPCVVVFRNHEPDPHLSIELTAGGTLSRPQSSQEVTMDLLRQSDKWSVPMPERQYGEAGGLRVGDLFEVHRGIATGANQYFVLARTEARRLGLPDAALRPLLPKARQLPSDVVEDVGDGYPNIDPQLCLLDCNLDEDQISAKYPNLAKYLSLVKSKGVLDRTLVRERHPWYRQERREPAPYLCTYMGRGTNGSPPLRFVWNKSQAVATNTYLMLYPKGGLAETIRQDPSKARALFEALQGTARDTISEGWRMHAGGMYKIEPGDLRRVRIASSPSWLRGALDANASVATVGSTLGTRREW